MLAPADQDFTARLSALLPPGRLSPPEPRYLAEPRGLMSGQGGSLARPVSTDEVAVILRACNEAHVGVVPYGGGTGLVGGQVKPDGPAPLVLSLERMNAIVSVDADENVLICGAGAILADVQAAAKAAGRLFPLTLASQGSARIGGLLSTNAGGVNVLRYGNTRDLCLGIEAVLADGTVIRGLSRLRKDNTGYDLRHLMIGAEGTLGVITAASFKLFPRPPEMGTAMFVVKGPAEALALLQMAQEMTGGAVSAFELIARQGMLFLDETMPDIRQPFATRPDWMVLAELGMPAGADPGEQLGHLFAAASAEGLVSDGVIASSGAQAAAFWSLREALPEANRRIGALSSHDISVPLTALPDFIRDAGAAVAALAPFRINCFGHVGDGNLHYNVFPPKGSTRADWLALRAAVKQAVHDVVAAKGGSVSAEHGIGRLKSADLQRYGDPGKLAAMRAIKAALDPNGIMNPGAVLAEAPR